MTVLDSVSARRPTGECEEGRETVADPSPPYPLLYIPAGEIAKSKKPPDRRDPARALCAATKKSRLESAASRRLMNNAGQRKNSSNPIVRIRRLAPCRNCGREQENQNNRRRTHQQDSTGIQMFEKLGEGQSRNSRSREVMVGT